MPGKIHLLTAVTLLLCILAAPLQAQEKQYRVGCIGFYNIENLFDTINDPDINDEEFLPRGKNEWTGPRYLAKLQNLAEVIVQIGDEMVKGGPVVLGLSEIENRAVLEDLVATPLLAASGYNIVHFDGPDRRGVDVAMIYREAHFKVITSQSRRLHKPDMPDWRTRDQLVVSGLLDGEKIYLVVNHWPSRSGGESKSAPLRKAAALLTRAITDSILHADPAAKIIVMGDLNDNPTDKSLLQSLGAKKTQAETGPNDLFNPMYKMYKQDGLGSNAYRDSWSLFDQVLVSGNLLGDDKSSFRFFRARVFNRPFLTQKEGAYKGYPNRTYAGGVYRGGYSDHFPVYLFLVREK